MKRLILFLACSVAASAQSFPAVRLIPSGGGANGVTLKAPTVGSSFTLDFSNAAPVAMGDCLKDNTGSGGLIFAACSLTLPATLSGATGSTPVLTLDNTSGGPSLMVDGSSYISDAAGDPGSYWHWLVTYTGGLTNLLEIYDQASSAYIELDAQNQQILLVKPTIIDSTTTINSISGGATALTVNEISSSSPALVVGNTGSGYGISVSNSGGGIGISASSASTNAAISGANSGSGDGITGAAVTGAGVAGSASGTSGVGVSGVASGTSGIGVYGNAGGSGSTEYGGFFNATGSNTALGTSGPSSLGGTVTITSGNLVVNAGAAQITSAGVISGLALSLGQSISAAAGSFTVNTGGSLTATGSLINGNEFVTGTFQSNSTVEAGSGFKQGSNVGVTCSGAPSSSFAASLGIVTHC